MLTLADFVVGTVTGVLLVFLVYRFDVSLALAVSGIFVGALIIVSLPAIGVGLVIAALGYGSAHAISVTMLRANLEHLSSDRRDL